MEEKTSSLGWEKDAVHNILAREEEQEEGQQEDQEEQQEEEDDEFGDFEEPVTAPFCLARSPTTAGTSSSCIPSHTCQRVRWSSCGRTSVKIGSQVVEKREERRGEERRGELKLYDALAHNICSARDKLAPSLRSDVSHLLLAVFNIQTSSENKQLLAGFSGISFRPPSFPHCYLPLFFSSSLYLFPPPLFPSPFFALTGCSHLRLSSDPARAEQGQQSQRGLCESEQGGTGSNNRGGQSSAAVIRSRSAGEGGQWGDTAGGRRGSGEIFPCSPSRRSLTFEQTATRSKEAMSTHDALRAKISRALGQRDFKSAVAMVPDLSFMLQPEERRVMVRGREGDDETPPCCQFPPPRLSSPPLQPLSSQHHSCTPSSSQAVNLARVVEAELNGEGVGRVDQRQHHGDVPVLDCHGVEPAEVRQTLRRPEVRGEEETSCFDPRVPAQQPRHFCPLPALFLEHPPALPQLRCLLLYTAPDLAGYCWDIVIV
eukprot:768611-Hanusia_phi.AAC.2